MKDLKLSYISHVIRLAFFVVITMIVMGCSDSTSSEGEANFFNGLQEGDILVYQYFDGVIQGDEFHVFEETKEFDTLYLEVLSKEDGELMLKEYFVDDAASWSLRYPGVDTEFTYRVSTTESDLVIKDAGILVNETLESTLWFSNRCAPDDLKFDIDHNQVFIIQETNWWRIPFDNPESGKLFFYEMEDRSYVNVHYTFRDCSSNDGPSIFNGYDTDGTLMVSYNHVQQVGEIFGFRLIGEL